MQVDVLLYQEPRENHEEVDRKEQANSDYPETKKSEDFAQEIEVHATKHITIILNRQTIPPVLLIPNN